MSPPPVLRVHPPEEQPDRRSSVIRNTQRMTSDGQDITWLYHHVPVKRLPDLGCCCGWRLVAMSASRATLTRRWRASMHGAYASAAAGDEWVCRGVRSITRDEVLGLRSPATTSHGLTSQ